MYLASTWLHSITYVIEHLTTDVLQNLHAYCTVIVFVFHQAYETCYRLVS